MSLKNLSVLITAVMLVFSLPGCDLSICIPGSQPVQNAVIEPLNEDDGAKNTTIDPSGGDDIGENIVYGGDIAMITYDDLVVVYNGFPIDSIRPFSGIATDLGIEFDAEDLLSNGTIERIASTSVEGINYYLRNYHYPSADDREITIQYVFDETLRESWIVSIDIFGGDTETKRGVKVGDHEEDMLKFYGGELAPAYSSERAYYYYLHPEINYCGIAFIADNDTGLITNIYIDYTHDETFRKLGIVSLD